jgi:hypothetical protein
VDWRVKGLIQKGLDFTPGGVWLNTRLQQTLGGMQDFDGNVAVKMDDWALSMGYLSDVNFRVMGSRIMEIGTGWHPTLPLCFVLAGAGSVATFDIVRLLGKRATFRLLRQPRKAHPNNRGLRGGEFGHRSGQTSGVPPIQESRGATEQEQHRVLRAG